MDTCFHRTLLTVFRQSFITLLYVTCLIMLWGNHEKDIECSPVFFSHLNK